MTHQRMSERRKANRLAVKAMAGGFGVVIDMRWWDHLSDDQQEHWLSEWRRASDREAVREAMKP